MSEAIEMAHQQYLEGDPIAAWESILLHPCVDDGESQLIQEVCDKFCERFLLNLESMVQCLRDVDFHFTQNPVTSLDSYDEHLINLLSDSLGPLPLVLVGLWRTVGTIDLRGEADWCDPYPDELVVWGPVALEEDVREWNVNVDELGEECAGEISFTISLR